MTGIQLNRSEKPERRSLNCFFTIFSSLIVTTNFCHTVYYVYQLATGAAKSTLMSQGNNKAENATSAELLSRMINIIDHIIFLFGINFVFFIISFSKLGLVWNVLLDIEKKLILTLSTYNHIRNITIIGLFLLFLVNIFNTQYLEFQKTVNKQLILDFNWFIECDIVHVNESIGFESYK